MWHFWLIPWKNTHLNRDIVHIQKKTLIRKLYTHCKIKLNFVQILNYYLHTHCHWTGGNETAESTDRKGSGVLFKARVLFFCREATLYNSASEHNLTYSFPDEFQCQLVAEKEEKKMKHGWL